MEGFKSILKKEEKGKPTNNLELLNNFKDKLRRLKLLGVMLGAMFLSIENSSAQEITPGSVSPDGKFYKITQVEGQKIEKLTKEVDSLINIVNVSSDYNAMKEIGNCTFFNEDGESSVIVGSLQKDNENFHYSKRTKKGESYSVALISKRYPNLNDSKFGKVNVTEDQMFIFDSSDPQKKDIVTEAVYKNTFSTGDVRKVVSSEETGSNPMSGKTLGSCLQHIKDELVIVTQSVNK